MRLYDYPASANCWKVWTMLRLTGRFDAVERVTIDIFGGDALDPAFLAVNPLARTPVLALDDGRILRESNAIAWYVADGSPYLPPDAADRADALSWLLIEQTEIEPTLGNARFRRLTGREPLDPEGTARMAAAGRRGVALLDAHLADGRDWLVGDGPSVADVCCAAYARLADDAGVALAGFPAVAAWRDRLMALPGVIADVAPYPPNAGPWAGGPNRFDPRD